MVLLWKCSLNSDGQQFHHYPKKKNQKRTTISHLQLLNIKTQEHMPGNAVGQAQQNVEVKPINVPSLSLSLSLSVKLLNQYDMNTRNKRHRSLSLSLSQ